MKQDIRLPFPPPYFYASFRINLISLIPFFFRLIDHVGIAFAFRLSLCRIRLTLIRISQLINHLATHCLENKRLRKW